MKTLSIFQELKNTITEWRKRDTIAKECSVQAYEVVKPDAELHRIKIRKCLATAKEPLTAIDIAKQTGLTQHQVSRRTSELRDKGLIEEVGWVRIDKYRYTLYQLKK